MESLYVFNKNPYKIYTVLKITLKIKNIIIIDIWYNKVKGGIL